MLKLIGQTLEALLLVSAVTPAGVWHRGHTEIFAILPELPGGPVPSNRAVCRSSQLSRLRVRKGTLAVFAVLPAN